MGAFKKFFKDWQNGAGGDAHQQTGDQATDIGRMTNVWDPWPQQIRAMSQQAYLHKLVIGAGSNGNLITTEPRRNLLILGPPRSAKTAGVLIPAILNHPGPLVSTSTKADVLRATGLVRARLGRVWHYSPDGGKTPPGCAELRWSPIPPSVQWAAAIAIGKAMADISESSSGGSGGGENSSYFRVKSGVVIAALLHAAALELKPMMWLLKAVNGDRKVLAEAAEILDGSLSPDSQIAASDLTGVLELDERSRGAIFATTANAFAAYRLPGALSSCDNPNFDPADFVAGDPDAFNPLRLSPVTGDATPMDVIGAQVGHNGRFDTVYITASSEQQNLVAPIVASFLSQIREATFALNRADEARDYFTRPPVLWALDEIAGIAPMRDLPETLAQSGGQGLLIAACLQDLQMARAKWDKAADAFLTLFGNVVIHAGIRDDDTLRAISTVIGKGWKDVYTEGNQQSSGGSGSSWSSQSGSTSQVSQQLVDRLDPGAISQGRVAQHPDFVLGLTPSGRGWGWFFCTPYYSASPWPHLLVSTMEYFARMGDPLEKFCGLAAPILDKDRTAATLAYSGGQAMADRYRTALGELRQLAERREQLLSSTVPGSLLDGYDDSVPVTLPAPARSFIALRSDVGQAEGLAHLLGMCPEIRWARPDEELLVNTQSTLTGHMTPFEDLSENPFVHPEWIIEAPGLPRHIGGISVVNGGAQARARTTPMTRWAGEIPGAGLVLEVWSTTRPAAYMARRLAEHLSTFTPTCLLTNDEYIHFGTWNQPFTTAA